MLKLKEFYSEYDFKTPISARLFEYFCSKLAVGIRVYYDGHLNERPSCAA
jgi:hypothetical protein